MKPTRRAWLRAVALAPAALTGCDRLISGLNREFFGEAVPERMSPPSGDVIDPDFHLLSRAAFGPRPGNLEHLRRIGREAWLEEQLEGKK